VQFAEPRRRLGCSSSRRRLLFATVPSKKGEAAEECSCI
jgi:hypothetical protein